MMHRLRNKKKTKGEEDDGVPPVPPVSKNFLKKNKTAVPEPPQVELDHVLPSSDDFRTSLLMPNLAQRFSILKAEQEALAAANASKEAGGNGGGGGFELPEMSSRFMGLGDIAETASIDGSIKSAHHRLTSRSDERRPSEDGDGSMMNRGRAGEGNVLFGGRQKIYKVAPSKTLRGGTSSMEDLGGGDGGGGGGGSGFGRSLAHHDVPDVPFSRREWRKGPGDDDSERKSNDLMDPDRNRYTTSSTNSTPNTAARLSTAATSINSQPGASVSVVPSPVSPTSMATNKPRRPLYEQALDQHLQDQQSTAMGRLERLASLRRMGSGSPPRSSSPGPGSPHRSISPSSPTSHSMMPWATQRTSPDTPLSPPAEEEMRSERGTSPRPPVFDTFDFGLHLQKPISPPMSSKGNEFPAQAPFSSGRPSGEGRGQQRSPERVASPVSDRSLSLGAVGARRSPSLVRRSPSPPPPRSSDELEVRSYLGSSNSNSERSSLDNNDLAPRRSGDSHSVRRLDINGGGSMRRRSPSVRVSTHDGHESEVSSVGSRISRASRVSSMSTDEPAKAFLEALKPSRNPSISASSPRFNSNTHSAEDDSPTLPSGQGQGLSLLVRQHLRSGSDASSMYAASTYTRMSRVSRYGVAASTTTSKYEDAAAAAAAEVSSEGSEPSSPSSASHVYGRKKSPATPPEIPSKAPGRSGSSLGNRTEDEDMRNGSWERGRMTTDSRPGSEWGDSRPGTRAPSRAGTERSLSRAGGDPDDQDWEQQLAFRRQIVQQNLRNQEKINSQHEMPYDHPKELMSRGNTTASSFGGIKVKGSNIIRTDNGRSPVVPRAESRERGRHDGRTMDARSIRGPMSPPGHPAHGRSGHPAHSGHPGPGPHGFPGSHGPPGHPSASPRPQQRQRPPLATNHTFGPGGNGSRSADPLSPASSRSRHTSPRNSPPRVRQQLSHEQMNGNRGQPMGWQDSFDQPPMQTRSTPSTPVPRQGPMPPLPPLVGGKIFRPAADGFRDDLSRAMMTGQSNITEVPRQRMRNGSSPEEPMENVRSTFEDEDHRPSPLRRPRGNSLIQGVQGLRSRNIDRESTQLPPLNTAGLLPPNAIGTPNSLGSRSPATPGPSPTPSPAVAKSPAAIMQQIANANSSLAPARKRVVNKFEIGEPTLLSKTSHIPTINLPNRPADGLSIPHLLASSAQSIKSSAQSTKSRKRNNTIFGVFGRNNTTEDIPSLPQVVMPTTATPTGGDGFPDRSNRASYNTLRKSTSDGGALASRARMDEVNAMRHHMPKIQKPMAGGMI
ncbi:hypothetical protein BZA05DRAFT_117715 [Tricharina praecox]|uniref:uncharacterized protein n=1 Tax=Tricharina praecox TaxID=43433 RepID=UPI00221F3CDE|nr:uncharacterized protein BZA05DRAFT_117715 [Tricharina praecox]KAI5848010.1 hypothetical protein BZA05DRAFT_117715 [Tricharina praecox]